MADSAACAYFTWLCSTYESSAFDAVLGRLECGRNPVDGMRPNIVVLVYGAGVSTVLMALAIARLLDLHEWQVGRWTKGDLPNTRKDRWVW